MKRDTVFSGIGRVLIVCSSEKGTAFVEEMLTEFCPETVVCVTDGAAARRLFLDGCAFDCVFINLPLTDETGAELAMQISEDAAGTMVMALLRTELSCSVGVCLSEHGVFTILKPVVRASFTNCVRIMIAAKSKIRALESEIAGLHCKIEEISYVSRAKIALVRERGMSEAEAHRYIEKMAMNKRRKRREIAAEILNGYEDA